MEKIRAILVDDEESARDVLENLLLRFCPEVDLVGKYENIPQAIQGIKEHSPDLVFLDIEMPNYAGYEIVNFFETVNFEIVFISAYDKYAVKAFEISAVDYLLKPIEIDRLKEAVHRVHSRLKQSIPDTRFQQLKKTLKEDDFSSIMIAEKGLHQSVQLAHIIAFEAHESYTYVHTAGKKFLVSKNLKHFESMLEDKKKFFRVHKSWIVNLDHLQNYSKTALEINLSHGVIARLSKYKKEKFESAMAGF